MKRVGWTALVAALCAVMAILWWRFGGERAQLAKAGEPTHLPPANAAIAHVSAVTLESRPPSQGMPPPVQTADYPAQLRAASDYLEFVRSLLAAARAGDHAAQFQIFRALDYCDDGYRGYFDRKRGRLTLDEALKRAWTHWPYESEEVRHVYDRCHTLMESGAPEFATRMEWLQRSAAGGYPLAQIIAAQQQWQGTIASNSDSAEKREQRRLMVASAIRSRDPAVIWEVGNTPLGPEPEDGELSTDNVPWYLAACQRGLDCSAQSEIVRLICRWDPRCQPYESVTDVIRRGNENEFPEFEARARWINEKIDAGDWEALGF